PGLLATAPLALAATAVNEHRHRAQLLLLAAQPVSDHALADRPHAGLQAGQRPGAHTRQVRA
ncbi:MAG: hypothetical protein OXD30_12410, partial [Bryobacterales bacterium]|nr:hypothetical protein [Bryobacterales bacterium]